MAFRRAARKDGNHAVLRDLWLRMGGSWLDLVPLVKGTPDALLGFRGADQLAEVKDPEAEACKRKLRPGQVEWHRAWRGRPVVKIETARDLETLAASLACPSSHPSGPATSG